MAMTPPSPEVSGFVLNVAADMTPVVGTAKGIYEAYQEPTWRSIGWAAAGLLPGVTQFKSAAKIAGGAAKGAGDVEKAAVSGKRTFSQADRASALEKAEDTDGVSRCQYCAGKPNSYEADHTIPHSRGGPSTLENLTPSCRTCNRSKEAKTPDEWGRP
jgi:hypothetical protein